MDPDNRDFLKLVRDTEAAVAALLGVLGAKLVSIITDKSRRGRRTQRELIDRVIRQYIESYRVVVTEAVSNTGGLQADKNAAALLPLLLKAGAEQEREYMKDRFKGYRELIRERFPTQRHPDDLRTFEQRVKTVRSGFERTVYRMVQQGVDEGTDPRTIAAMIRDSVVMTPAQTVRGPPGCASGPMLLPVARPPAPSSTTACASPARRWLVSTVGQSPTSTMTVPISKDMTGCCPTGIARPTNATAGQLGRRTSPPPTCRSAIRIACVESLPASCHSAKSCLWLQRRIEVKTSSPTPLQSLVS